MIQPSLLFCLLNAFVVPLASEGAREADRSATLSVRRLLPSGRSRGQSAHADAGVLLLLAEAPREEAGRVPKPPRVGAELLSSRDSKRHNTRGMVLRVRVRTRTYAETYPYAY